MGRVNCAVIGCLNSSTKLKKWESSACEEESHKGLLKKNCSCEKPFILYMFPSVKRNGEKRAAWIKLLKRETSKKIEWTPCSSDRVCSEHFVDKVPTFEHPHPSLNLGYQLKETSKRRGLFRFPLSSSKKQPVVPENRNDDDSFLLLSPPLSPKSPLPTLQSPMSEHSYCHQPGSVEKRCENCIVKKSMVESYVKKVNKLTKQLNNLKQCLRKEKVKNEKMKPFTTASITTDEKMNFYTGITSIAMFNAIFTTMKPFLRKLDYWQGNKTFLSTKVRRRKSTQKKLSPKNAMLLTLMRLRLGLLNEDLADRFGISKATCCNTFKTWIRFLSETLGKGLVKWLPKESIQENMPRIFRKAGHGNVRVVIDCSEVFIERPKSLQTQAQTWSDYKSHNTVKFLIGISPAGYITFLSDCYGGRANDRFICADSGFYDCLDNYDEVMADRGFQIKEELMLKFCTLTVPPGARLKSQMTTSEVKKTKHVANLRIHVERAINRIKTFRILKSVLPITMMHHCDDIVCICSALCNLKRLLFKESVKTD